MKNHKVLIGIIVGLIALCVVLVSVYIASKKEVTIPQDAECVATIYQCKSQVNYMGGDDSYTYEFYRKSKNKYIVKKIKQTNPGVTAQYFEPKVLYTKEIIKKDISEIKEEIQNKISECDLVTYTYIENDESIKCDSMDELCDRLF